MSNKTAALRHVDEAGRIYIGARAAAFEFRSSIRDQKTLARVMECMSTDFPDKTEMISLLYHYGYETADQLDRCFLLGTMLAFYGTDVHVKVSNELSGSTFSLNMVETWRAKIEKRLECFTTILRQGSDKLSLQAAGRAVEMLLDGLDCRDARLAALTFLLTSELVPYTFVRDIPMTTEKHRAEICAQLEPVLEELRGLAFHRKLTVPQIIAAAKVLASEAQLDEIQAEALMTEFMQRKMMYMLATGALNVIIIQEPGSDSQIAE